MTSFLITDPYLENKLSSWYLLIYWCYHIPGGANLQLYCIVEIRYIGASFVVDKAHPPPHGQSTNHISLKNKPRCYTYQVTHCVGRVSANTSPHQFHWGDREMGAAISCIECSQMAGLIQKVVENPWKHRLFMQLFFVQLSFVQS